MGTETERGVRWHDHPNPQDITDLEGLLGCEISPETRRYLAAEIGEGERGAGRFHVVGGSYIFGAIPVPEMIRREDRVIYHEVDVVLNETAFVTVRKAHPRYGHRFEPTILIEACPDGAGASSGELFFRLMEDVVEDYEDLLIGLQDEIDELEQAVGRASEDRIHRRYSDLRRDLIDARRRISPLIRALRAIEDERLDIDDRVFPAEIEMLLKDVKERLARLEESLPLVGDLLSGVRDYHQSYTAQRQNEVMQRLTVVASLLLVPTLIVGIYGQNFEHIPETTWGWGYGWSWFLIAFTTVIQLIIFWRLGWIGRRATRPEETEDLGSVLNGSPEERG